MFRKNLFSILVALLIIYLSLANADTFRKVSLHNIPNIDKLVHSGMYFIFMSVIIFENRYKLKSTGNLVLLAIIPFSYSILMEILQSAITVNRTGSFFDIVFNLAGILLSMLVWTLIKHFKKDLIK
jgi:VanZ family protein